VVRAVCRFTRPGRGWSAGGHGGGTGAQRIVHCGPYRAKSGFLRREADGRRSKGWRDSTFYSRMCLHHDPDPSGV